MKANETSQPAVSPGLEGPRARVRGPYGQFVKGNTESADAAKERKYHGQVAALRRAFLERLRPDEIASVVDSMVQLAKAGDVHAAALLLDKGLGRFADNAEGDEVAPTVKVVTLDITPELREQLDRPLIPAIAEGARN